MNSTRKIIVGSKWASDDGAQTVTAVTGEQPMPGEGEVWEVTETTASRFSGKGNVKVGDKFSDETHIVHRSNDCPGYLYITTKETYDQTGWVKARKVVAKPATKPRYIAAINRCCETIAKRYNFKVGDAVVELPPRGPGDLPSLRHFAAPDSEAIVFCYTLTDKAPEASKPKATCVCGKPDCRFVSFERAAEAAKPTARRAYDWESIDFKVDGKYMPPIGTVSVNPITIEIGDSSFNPWVKFAEELQKTTPLVRLSGAFTKLGPNAQSLLADIAERLAIGATEHGDFDKPRTPEQWGKEAYEEDLDGIVYRALRLKALDDAMAPKALAR